MTATQRQTIDVLSAHGGKLVRLPGGFWTYAGCPKTEHDAPVWYITVQTVRALERTGRLARANEYTDEWRDSRVLIRENGHEITTDLKGR